MSSLPQARQALRAQAVATVCTAVLVPDWKA